MRLARRNRVTCLTDRFIKAEWLRMNRVFGVCGIDVLLQPFGFAFFTAAVQNRLAFVQHKAVVSQQVLGKLMHHITVQVSQRTAIHTADMQMAFAAWIELVK